MADIETNWDLGGADIVWEMHESGELEELLERNGLRPEPGAIS